MGRLFLIGYERGMTVLGMYSKNPGIVYATPHNTEHIAHVTYVNSGALRQDNRSNIDYFIVTGTLDERVVTEKSVVLHQRDFSPEMADIERKHSINWNIISRFRHLEDTIRNVAIKDIYAHAYGKPRPLEVSNSRKVYSEDIKSEATIKKTRYANIDINGKQTFLPDCILDLNLDFANWCISGISLDGKLSPLNSCDYCYASYKHSGYPNIYHVSKKHLIEQITEAKKERAQKDLSTRYLRLGKRTEAGYDLFYEHILTTLEACLETGISVVFPTKFLQFDKNIAELLKRTDSTLLFSLGNDKFEKGPCLYGRTNNWRIEQAKKFLDFGVRAVPYVLIDAIKENGGHFFSRVLNEAMTFPLVQLIPIKIRQRALANTILGGWQSLIEGQEDDLLGYSCGGYEQSQSHSRLHIDVHTSIKQHIMNNNGCVRMCSHNNNTMWCGKCFMTGENGRIDSIKKVILEKKIQRRKKK